MTSHGGTDETFDRLVDVILTDLRIHFLAPGSTRQMAVSIADEVVNAFDVAPLPGQPRGGHGADDRREALPWAIVRSVSWANEDAVAIELDSAWPATLLETKEVDVPGWGRLLLGLDGQRRLVRLLVASAAERLSRPLLSDLGEPPTPG